GDQQLLQLADPSCRMGACDDQTRRTPESLLQGRDVRRQFASILQTDADHLSELLDADGEPASAQDPGRRTNRRALAVDARANLPALSHAARDSAARRHHLSRSYGTRSRDLRARARAQRGPSHHDSVAIVAVVRRSQKPQPGNNESMASSSCAAPASLALGAAMTPGDQSSLPKLSFTSGAPIVSKFRHNPSHD